MSRKTELFLLAKQRLRAHPDWPDEQIADSIGARLIEAEEIIREARKDYAADAVCGTCKKTGDVAWEPESRTYLCPKCRAAAIVST